MAEITINDCLRDTLYKAYHNAHNAETRRDYAAAIKDLVTAKIMLEKWAREKGRISDGI